jgi:hypothetical protein
MYEYISQNFKHTSGIQDPGKNTTAGCLTMEAANKEVRRREQTRTCQVRRQKQEQVKLRKSERNSLEGKPQAKGRKEKKRRGAATVE